MDQPTIVHAHNIMKKSRGQTKREPRGQAEREPRVTKRSQTEYEPRGQAECAQILNNSCTRIS